MLRNYSHELYLDSKIWTDHRGGDTTGVQEFDNV
jgi:hypothetical protein